MINREFSAFDILPVQKHTPPAQRGVFKHRSKKNNISCFAKENYRPYDLDLFLGAGCNAKCIYCFSHDFQNKNKGNRQESELSLKEYMQIIDQAFEFGVKMVIFVGRGEPFASEFLLPLVEYVDRKTMHSVIVTNGTLITERIAERYYNLSCSILVKLNSFNPKVQDQMLGVEGMSSRLYQGIRILMNAGFNKSEVAGATRLSVNNVVTKLNYKEVPQIIKWAVSHNIYPFLETLQWTGMAVVNAAQLQLDSREHKQLDKALEQLLSRGWSWMGSPLIDGETCGMNRLPLFINEKGNVIPCWMREDIVAGNIRNKDIKSLWNSKVLKKARLVHQRSKLLMKFGFIRSECAGRRHKRKLNFSKALPKASKSWQIRYYHCKVKQVKKALKAGLTKVVKRAKKNLRIPVKNNKLRVNKKLKNFVNFALRKRRTDYGVLVYCSGGKDSAYVLYLLKFHYKLNVLAYTYIHPLINGLARKNVRQITEIFNIDRLEKKVNPNIYNEVVRYGIIQGNKNKAPSIIGCMSCSYFRETIAFNLATDMGIPLIATGLRKHQFHYRYIPDKKISRKKQDYFHRFGYAQKLFLPLMREKYKDTLYCFDPDKHEDRLIPYVIHPLCLTEFIPGDIREFLITQFSDFKNIDLDPEKTNCDAVPFFDFLAYKSHNHSSYYLDHKYKLAKHGFVMMWGQPLSKQELNIFYKEESKILDKIAANENILFDQIKDKHPFLIEKFGVNKFKKYFKKYKIIHYYSRFFNIPLK